MRNRFDYIAKQFGQAAIRPFGTTVARSGSCAIAYSAIAIAITAWP